MIPAYGQRKGWHPKEQSDFGDGGSYPECHRAQYPLEMGRKHTSTNSGNTLALQVDQDGRVRYDAIAQQGHRKGVHVQSSFKDLVPLANRTDVSKDQLEMARPSEEEVQATADRTKAALEKLVNGKIKAAQPKNVPNSQGETSFMRYTPQQGGVQNQKIIKMVSCARFLRFPETMSTDATFVRALARDRLKLSKILSNRPSSRAKRSPADRLRLPRLSSGRRLAK